MAPERSLRRYRSGYALLLRLYPRPCRERFGEAMAQTFNDLLRERAGSGRGLFPFVLWLFADTCAGILKEHSTMASTALRSRNILYIALATGCLLLLPVLAMQFTDEVVWTPFDFVIAGILLFGTGLAYELVASRMDRVAYRIAAGIAVATALLLVWVNLAVGVIGSENNPANLMYLGVLAVGIIGIAIAHFRPSGMARALFATALAQALVAVIALTTGMQRAHGASVMEIIGGNAIFVVLFLLSALLFRRAADATVAQRRQQAPES